MPADQHHTFSSTSSVRCTAHTRLRVFELGCLLIVLTRRCRVDADQHIVPFTRYATAGICGAKKGFDGSWCL